MERRYPAEWEPHWATLIAWPHTDSDWAPWLDAVREEYLALARHILSYERLIILCRDKATAATIPAALHDASNHTLSIVIATCDDTWIRDYGPQARYTAGALELVDFAYNAWGGKFAFENDDRVSRELNKAGLWPTESFQRDERLTLEGGALETDGQGALMVRSSTLEDPRRNPHLTRDDIEQRLHETLGVSRILWLDAGHLEGDDTDGHIDTLARFVDSETIVYQRPPETDTNAKAYERALSRLTTRQGTPFRLIGLPVANPIHASDSEAAVLPASYANYLHVNGAVIVPAYGQASDEEARTTLARCFPDKTVLSSPARTLIEQFGSLHCATLHIPACESSQP